jgi:hypothetical protein
LKAELPQLAPTWQREIELPPVEALGAPERFKPHPDRPQFQLGFLARMIFSCLVDADYIDTELFYKNVSGERNLRDGRCPGLVEVREKLDQYLCRFEADTPVNELRAEILQRVRGNALREPGLFCLTVPTGGGKTLSSLAFALDHAIQHGFRRVIYVIPFTSIVEQNAAVFREAFGELGELAVLEHHSGFLDDDRHSPEARDKLRLAMENWDAPGQTGQSFNLYDRTSKRWHQTWVDSNGGLHEYWGGLKDGNMVFMGQVPLPPGARFAGRHTVRLTFFPLGADRVRQFSEALGPDGTWSVSYDLIYTRRAKTP